MADSALFDPTGEIWSRAGHWPLFLTVGTARGRAPDAVERRNVKWQKTQYWNDNHKQATRNGCESGHWPWWIEHPSERLRVSPCSSAMGRNAHLDKTRKHAFEPPHVKVNSCITGGFQTEAVPFQTETFDGDAFGCAMLPPVTLFRARG